MRRGQIGVYDLLYYECAALNCSNGSNCPLIVNMVQLDMIPHVMDRTKHTLLFNKLCFPMWLTFRHDEWHLHAKPSEQQGQNV